MCIKNSKVTRLSQGLYSVQSDREGIPPYEVRFMVNGERICNCRGFEYHATNKHVDRVQSLLDELTDTERLIWDVLDDYELSLPNLTSNPHLIWLCLCKKQNLNNLQDIIQAVDSGKIPKIESILRVVRIMKENKVIPKKNKEYAENKAQEWKETLLYKKELDK